MAPIRFSRNNRQSVSRFCVCLLTQKHILGTTAKLNNDMGSSASSWRSDWNVCVCPQNWRWLAFGQTTEVSNIEMLIKVNGPSQFQYWSCVWEEKTSTRFRGLSYVFNNNRRGPREYSWNFNWKFLCIRTFSLY